MLRHGIAAALLLLAPASAGFPLEASQARAGRLDDPDRTRSAAEFPAADGQISGLQQNGQRAKDVARRLAARQADVETLQLLVDLQRHDDALTLLQTIVETRPELIAEAFNALGFRTRDMLADAARNYGERLRAIVSDARRRASALPREQAAEVARALVTIESEFARDRGAWRASLASFVRDYEGTETALLAQVDLLTDASGSQKLEALDAFVTANPGTNAAAKALYLKGFDLSHNPFSFGERKGHDPTDRFFRVVAIVKELGSKRYPASEWVDKAPRLIVEFSSFEPAYAAGNPERILAVYEEELPLLLAAYEADPARSDLAFVVGWRMGDLLRLKGDALAGVDAVFDRLDRMAASPDSVKLLRAEFYLSPSGRSFDKVDRTMLREKASAQLEWLAKNSKGFHQRRAVATLAKLRFDDGKFDAARALFRRYLESHPDASYAWVAALRIAQCDQSLGNVKEAAGEFRRAAERFRANPLAVVLGRAYAARAAEAAGEFGQALGDYKAAQSAWDADYGSAYSLYATRRAIPGEPFLVADDDRVTRDAVTARIAELTRSLDLAGGVLVERGRWLLARERWRDAEAPLLEFLAARAASPLAPEARELLHRARLEQALELADAERSATDVDAAVSALTSLAAEPPDFAVCTARIAVATIAALRGSREEADATMAGAMRAWQSLDAKPSAPRTDVERDVIEIRNAVFRPKGDGVYAGGQRWNAFNWESGGAPYVVLDPELRVKASDGRVATIEARDPFPEVPNVVFLDARRRVLLERVMLKLGGTKRRAWTSVMQTPNQPAGPSMDVLRFWQRSFPAQPGHWGGWVFLTYPIVGEIEFIDAARTKATARVTVGYSGATVQMEKRNGTWVARELTNFWIT